RLRPPKPRSRSPSRSPSGFCERSPRRRLRRPPPRSALDDPSLASMTSQPERPAGAPGSLEPAPGEPIAPLLPPDLDATIVLLRHGESDWITKGLFQGQGDSPLSDLGRRQAALAAKRLARPHANPALPIPSGPPVAIHHSPLSRTTDTAPLLATA